jgi:hypothetical protein
LLGIAPGLPSLSFGVLPLPICGAPPVRYLVPRRKTTGLGAVEGRDASRPGTAYSVGFPSVRNPSRSITTSSCRLSMALDMSHGRDIKWELEQEWDWESRRGR